MKKKKVLSQRELRTEKILQTALPEYVIRANVRLADVMHAGDQFQWMSGYHLDFIICDEEANTIAAVELDDSTHDTEDGERKDANKNRWMADAKIKLIRIREPEEAHNIRALMKEPSSFDAASKKPSLHKILSTREASSEILAAEDFERIAGPLNPLNSENRLRISNRHSIPTNSKLGRYFARLIVAVIVIGLLMSVVNSVIRNGVQNIGKSATAAAEAKTNWYRQQEAEQAAATWKKQVAEQAKTTQQAEIKVAQEPAGSVSKKPPFDSVYKKPVQCENPATMDVMIECSNDYIRKKHKFDMANGN